MKEGPPIGMSWAYNNASVTANWNDCVAGRLEFDQTVDHHLSFD